MTSCSRFQNPLPVNILRGIVPTASVWGTNPTNLGNCTDGNYSTVTGTGSKVMGSAGQFGRLIFDLGISKSIVLAGRVGVWSSAGTIIITIETSEDGITYNGFNNTSSASLNYTRGISSASEKVTDAYGVVVKGQYLSFGFWVDTAATANTNLYEIVAHELGL